MLLATSSVSFGDVLLTVLEFAFLFLWIWIAVQVIFDVFRSKDLSNWAKALWILFIFILPLIGVLAYLIVRGHSLHEHEVQDRAQLDSFREYQARAAATGPMTDDLGRLADLHDRGVLNADEFEAAKARLPKAA